MFRPAAIRLARLAQQWAAAPCVTAQHNLSALVQASLDPSWQSCCDRLVPHRMASSAASSAQHQEQACTNPGCTDHSHSHSHGQPKKQLTFEEQESTCWSCHDRFHRGGLVCRSCDRIQPVDSSLTHFELMGYSKPTFDLDPAALEKRYKLLQWQLHPDKSVGKTAEERQYSADQAALINQAYGVLRNPLSRANYLLMMSGMSHEEFEATIADPELLMEVMDTQEQVDQTDDQEQLVKLHTANKQRQAALCSQLSQAFGSNNIELAKQLVAQLSYWARLEEAICNKL